MFRHRHLIALLMILLIPTLAGADAHVVSKNGAGVPSFVTGDLGWVDPADGLPLKGRDEVLFGLSAKSTLLAILRDHFGAAGSEDMEVIRVRRDEVGTVHVRFQQHLNGLPVVGAEMWLHAESKSGRVYAVNGELAPDFGVPAPAAAKASAADLVDRLAKIGVAGTAVETPELLYFHDAETAVTHLAWKVRVQGVENGQFFDNDVYVDARTSKVVAVDARVHTAKDRRSYDATGSVVTATSITGLPGTLKCTESNQNCNDASVQRAHDGAGNVYDYYQARFGRDSLNGAGMTLTSSAHVGSNWANAAWYNNQMVYGDGDGVDFDDLTKSYDVIAHELTHGVTDFESNLLYQKESGAMNEALSDIFGVSADSYKRGVVDAATWKLGEEVYTPGTSGDALRYMNNPTADGYSTDYYPERLYPGSCTPSNSNDQCGVHGNSGIANLAYYLLVAGGTHPRGKTTVSVPAIGMTKAEQIFYRAQTSCLTSSSNFEATRNCTAQAATDLYGSTENSAVHKAWDAVGVPGGGGGALTKGVPVTGLSGSTGSSTFYTINVPAGATDLTVNLSGGTGDADLYVRFGAQPSTSTYDCRSWASGNNESCSFATPQTGTYHILVYAYSTYSGATLVASYTEPSGGGTLSNGVPKTNLSGATGSETFYTIDVPSGATNLTFNLSGGTGDADLYVRFGSAPTTSTFDCRSWNSSNNESCSFPTPQTGTYHVMIRGYAAYSGATLVASYTEPSSCGDSGSATNLSASTGQSLNYTFAVDACATTATFTLSGGTGDADLYVRFGSQPTTSVYDCRSWNSGNNETCTFTPPQAGTYHIMVRAYTTFSGVNLNASYE